MAKEVIKKKESPFASALLATRRKKIGANALDYFLLLILSVLIFLLVNLITENLGSVKSKQSEISSVQNEMVSLVTESKLGEYENGSYKSNEEIATSYIYRLTYRSLLDNGVKEENITSSITSIYKPIDKESDNLFYYYATFKANNIADYSLSTQQKEEYGSTYYFEALSKDLSISFDLKDEYPLLTLDGANKVQSYILDSSFTPGKEIYSSLLDRYETLLKSSINEFESEYLPFKNKMEAHERIKGELYGVRRIEILIAYVLGSSLYYLLLPSLLKNGRSLSFKAMNIAYCTKKGETPAFSNILIHFAVLLFEFSSVMAIIPFIIYGSSAIDLVYLPFWSGISLLFVALFSLTFMLFSYLSTFIDKESKATTSEFASSLIAKDITRFALKNNEKKEEDDNGK